jgi:1-acyl-sn-glycerol-3-phosphate acyltransferase
VTLLRGIWFLLTVPPLTIFIASWIILASWAGVRYEPHGLYDRLVRRWARWLVRLHGIPLTVTGRDRLDPDQSYVFAANHESFVDVWALVLAIPHSCRFVAKKELTKVPFFGPAMEDAGHISIDRRNLQSAFGSYDQAAEAIRSGLSAAVFVEGTRSRDGVMLPFKKGPFVLAIRAGVPIVPVLIRGGLENLPKGSIAVRGLPMSVQFGEPIPTAGLAYEDRDALSARCRAAMQEMKAR